MTIDLSTVPLVAISASTKQVISTLLNPTRVLPCENGLPRNWRGFAYLLDFSVEDMSLLSSHSNPAMHLFTILEQNRKDVTIKDFQTTMEHIGRWDVIDETETMFESDATKYLKEKERANDSADVIKQSVDQQILTQGDVHRLRQGLETQYYDAFLLYADEDVDFVKEMVDKLETEYQLKLCLKDRDLVAGITFEHEAVMKIIYERCNRVLIIISPAFLESSANKFFLSYSQALSIDKRQRKIVPCLYKKCELPMQLKYMFILDYNRKNRLYDFWGKLRDSIKTSVSDITSNTIQSTSCNAIDTSHDKHDISQTHEEASKEISETPQKKVDNCDIKNINKTVVPSETKKNKTLLKWVKGTTNRKTKQTKKNDALIVHKVESLPSLESMDSLSLSTIDLYKSKKKNLFDKFTKKGQFRKVAVHAR